MAAAEARAVWQRAANRCFVQEDAKRAPKLACCQSSSSTSKPVDPEPTTEVDKPDHHVAGFKPLNRTPSYSDLPPHTRWWLQLQPTYGYQKGLTHEQLNALEAEVEMLTDGIGKSTSKFNTEEFSAEIHHRVSNVDVRKDCDVGKQDVKAVYSTNSGGLESIDVGDSYEKMEMDSLGCSDSKKASEFGFDPELLWIGSEKTDPWWRVTDRNDLASFVAQKSLDHIENCDLPPPQKMHVRGRNPYSGLRGLKSEEIMPTSSDWKVKNGVVSSKAWIDQGSQASHDPGIAEGRHWNSGLEHMQYEPAKSFRTYNFRNDSVPTQKKSTDTHLSDSDPSKAELLEALRHSQTRAREAEKAAQQAYAEKEDIVKLFFRQASQLFAYKQWIKMLQLETLYLQIKNNEQPISSFFPVGLPWMPLRGKTTAWKSWQKGAKGKRGKRNLPRRHNVRNYFAAIALGLGLVSVGLLLGWTVGWLLPF